MSEFLAEARILVRPDTTKFRALLEAELAAAIKPISVPVVPLVASGLSAATAQTNAFTTAQAGAAAETQAVAAALEKETIAATQATAAQSAHSKSVAGVARGAGASALTLFGLRGATLAASGAFLAGTAAVVGFSKALQSAAALETELNVFKVTAGATADEMDRVSASAKQLGRDITLPGVTASTAATAMTELAKAGLSVQDSLAGARGALQLATAAQIDVTDSTNLVAGALNAFQLSGNDAVKVADLLTGAAKSSQGEITDMGTALSQAAAVSHQFGVSIEDTVTLLTELAQAGIAGGRAGTSLRVAFLRLVNPPAAAAKALKELNVQIRDAQGNLRPQIFTDISDALQGYSKAQRDATLATIFGADAIRTAGIIGAKGAQSFDKTRDAVTEVGLAQEAAAARTQGLQGDIENLSNQMSSLGLTFGQVAKGPTSAFVKSLADVVSQMNTVADGTISLIAGIKDFSRSVDDAVPILGAFDSHLGDIAKATTFINPLTGQLQLAAKAFEVFGGGADDAGKKNVTFGNIADSVTASVNGLANALKGAAAGLKAQLPQDTGLGVKQLQNVVGGFDAEEVRARITGDNKKILDVLQTEQTFLQNQLQRQFVKNRPALKRALEQSLLGVVNDIGSIKAAAAAANARLQAESKRIADAQAKAVADAAKERREKIAAAAAEAKRLAEAQQQAQEQARQDLLTGFDLDIGLAQITDNQKAEVAARQRKIRELNRELAAEAKEHGKSTLLYKQIRNEIASQTAAINEITKAKQKQNTAQSFAQATFDFLQTQQGFASNLLGNLIPGGQTGGVVGGAVQGALQPQASAADGRSQNTPTSGQANATNHILTQILGQLKQINGTQAAPEANRQRAGQNAIFDYQAGF